MATFLARFWNSTPLIRSTTFPPASSTPLASTWFVIGIKTASPLLGTTSDSDNIPNVVVRKAACEC
jgi:hypothetical protein